MPWYETNPMKERMRFIREVSGGLRSFSEVCERFGISRKTGYKWLQRYGNDGPDGLQDRSHRPHFCPHATNSEVLQAAFEMRRRRPRWGAPKIRARLQVLRPDWHVPAARVLHKHLQRAGLVVKKRRNRPRPHPGRPTAPFTEPNAIWSADYKGQFKMKNGRYCYPLTVQDGFSRYLLACQAVDGTTYDAARQVFTRLFREFGMPRRIRTDNGSPFSSALALGRLSRLSVWWVRLGILPDFTEPASPQQNGRHERMHKDLKADACIPSAGNRAAQQRRFNAFRDDFNHIRPHEALDQKPPASSYQPSSRSFPNKIPPLEYPAHFETRKVSTNGGIRWHSDWINVSHLLGGEYIGLEEVAVGVWAVYFGPVFLGWLHIEKGAIIDDDGSRSRNPRL
jgi:putative transposase